MTLILDLGPDALKTYRHTCDLDLYPMTLIYKRDLDILKTPVYINNEVSLVVLILCQK